MEEKQSERSLIDEVLYGSEEKNWAELEMEKHFPNLPSWVYREYTAIEWMWLSDEEKFNIMNYGTSRLSSFEP